MVNSLENYETLSALFGVLRKVLNDHIKECTKTSLQAKYDRQTDRMTVGQKKVCFPTKVVFDLKGLLKLLKGSVPITNLKTY